MKNYILYNSSSKKEMEIIIKEKNVQVLQYFGGELSDQEAYDNPLNIPLHTPGHAEETGTSMIHLWRDSSGFYRIQITGEDGSGIFQVRKKEGSIETISICLDRNSLCRHLSVLSSSSSSSIMYSDQHQFGRIERSKDQIQLHTKNESTIYTFSIERAEEKLYFKHIKNGEVKENLYIAQENVDRDFFTFYCLYKMNYLPFTFESLPL